MLHILLLILKIIGIVLLVVLGLILLILCAVLFIPIRYQFDTRYFDDPKVFARISWLLRIVCVNITYDSDFHMIVKLFGITIVDSKKPKPKKTKELNKETKENKNNKNIKNDEKKSNDKSEIVLEKTEEVKPMDSSVDEKNEEKTKKSISQSLKKVYDIVIDKIKDISKKIVSAFENIQTKIDNIINKLTHINEKKDAILAILFAKENKASFLKTKTTLFRMLGSLLPRKIRAEISFGFDDPSTTGFVLGIASMFYPVYLKNVHLYPDFQNKVFEGWIKGRGRIRVFAFVKAAAILILDKKIRNIFNDFKKVFK